jgi:hypothetical protein
MSKEPVPWAKRKGTCTSIVSPAEIDYMLTVRRKGLKLIWYSGCLFITDFWAFCVFINQARVFRFKVCGSFSVSGFGKSIVGIVVGN